MTPSVHCEGCNEKWKTADEQATPEKIQALINAAVEHKGKVDCNNSLNLMSATIEAFSSSPGIQRSVHTVVFTYHETTPSTGFEEAHIV